LIRIGREFFSIEKTSLIACFLLRFYFGGGFIAFFILLFDTNDIGKRGVFFLEMPPSFVLWMNWFEIKVLVEVTMLITSQGFFGVSS
jgi:hypothetical protein